MSWNGSIALTSGAAWSGSPQVITSRQYQSTNTVFDTGILSTGKAVIVASNVLQTQVNAIVATGTTSLWANFRAINNVDLSGNNLYNAKSLSTMNLQVSSINGTDFSVFGSTISIGGVTIVNNTISADTVEKTTSVVDTINNAAGAVGKAVSAVNSATTGTLANLGTVLQQVYWGTAAVDSVVSLTNGVVELATGIQGLVDSRQKNTISGPAGPPGQTTNVYETFNHTTQLQFSTLGSDIFTVLRTTDQRFPNQTLGREVFISTFIPAGSKVVRSLSDPMSMPIMSTQVLSTTNFAQSFGQWAAILSPDYNLKVSSLQVANLFGFSFLSTNKISTITLESSNVNVNNLLNTTNLYVGGNATVIGGLTSGSFATGDIGALSLQATSVSSVGLNVSSINGVAIFNVLNPAVPTNIPFLSSLTLSTGSVQLSSINGQPISVYVNAGDVVFNSVSTLMISTGRALISSINDSIKFTNQPIGNNIEGINDLRAATATFNTSLATNGSLTAGSAILGTTRVTGLFRVTDGGGANIATITTGGAITGTSLTTGGGAITGGTGSFSGAVTAAGVNSSGAISGTNTLTITGGTTLTGGNIVDTIGGTTANFTTINTPTANLTNANITNTNTTNINAGSGTLNLQYGSILFNGSASLTQTPLNFLSSFTLSTGSIQVSSINGVAYSPGGSGTLPSGLVSTPNLIGLVSTPNLIGLLSTYVSTFTNFNISNLQASTVAITGGLVFSTIGSAPDITNIFTSSTTAFDSVSSATNDILNYQMNLTSLPPTFDMGGFLDISSLNRTLWLYKSIIFSGQFTPGQNPTLNLVGAVTSGDFFDIRNTSPTAVLSVWNPYESGGFLMNILPGQFYRFTYTTSWSAAANPTQNTQTTTNLLSLSQGWTSATISTNNILNINAGQTNILGFAQIGNANINDLTAQQATIVSSQTRFANISSLTVSSINSRVFIANATIPQIFNSTMTNTNGLTFSTPSTLFDISKITSLSNFNGPQLTGYNNNILNYEFDTTVNTQPIITYPFPASGDTIEFFWPQVGTWGEAINTFAAGPGNTLFIILGVSTGIGTPPLSGFTDIKNTNQTTLYVSVTPSFTRYQVPLGSTYRFSWTTNGTTWTVNTSPSPVTATTLTNFNITQNFAGVNISTSDILYVDATSIYLNAPYTQVNKLVGLNGYISSLQTDFISSGTLQITSLSTGTMTTTGIITAGGNITTAGNVAGVNGTFSGSLTGASLATTNLNTSNLFASNTRTSSINIQTGVSSFINASFSNNFTLGSYTNPPNVNVNLLNSQLQTFSQNPSFTYSGTAGTDVITLDNSNRVWLNNTLQNPANIGWFLTTITATTGVRLNISTVAGVGNYSPSQQVANLVATTAAPIAIYTSAAGFIGNLTSGSLTLQWTGTDFNTTSFVPFTGVNFINTTTLSQSISTFTLATTSNIEFNSGVASNVPSISFGGRTVEVFRQRVDGFVTANGNFGRGDASATIVSPFGQTFPVSQYNCIVAGAAVNIYQQYSLAVNEQAWTTSADGNGNWRMAFNLTSPTIPVATNPNFYAIAAVTMIPYDLGHFSGFQTPTNLGEGLGPGPLFAEIQLSTVTTSTLTMLVNENISITAGIAVPAFIGTGSIFIGGTGSTELVGDQAVLGGLTDVNIAALTGNVNMTAGSNIQLTASTLVYVNDMAFTTNNPANWLAGTVHTLYGDVINGGKYLQWSYDNNPGTLLTDNHSISLDAPVINSVGNLDMCNNNIKTVGLFSRMLSGTAVDQPIIQYGTDGVSGGSGSVNITLGTAYTSSNSYVAFACMMDTDPAQMAVARADSNIITISWANGGGGSHTLSWQTMGT